MPSMFSDRIGRAHVWTPHLNLAAEDAWKRLLSSSITGEVRLELKQRADADAIHVFRSDRKSTRLDSPLESRSGRRMEAPAQQFHYRRSTPGTQAARRRRCHPGFPRESPEPAARPTRGPTGRART